MSDMTEPSRAHPVIELLYDADCPNVEECRTALRQALIEIGAAAVWHEWDRSWASTPIAYRHLGSPTVLLNGRDICGPDAAKPEGRSCRLYADEAREHLCGAPSVRDSGKRTIGGRRLMDRVRSSASTGNDARALGAASTGLVAAVATIIAGTCCVSPVLAPLIVGLLSASGAAWAAGLKPYGGYILTATFLLLSFAFWNIYRPRRNCDLGGAATQSPQWLSRLSKGVLWAGAAGWLSAVIVRIAIP